MTRPASLPAPLALPLSSSQTTPLFLIVFCESKLEEMVFSTPHIWPPFPYEPQKRPYMGVASIADGRIRSPSYG